MIMRTDSDILEDLRHWKEIFSIELVGADIVIHGSPGDAMGGFAILTIDNASNEIVSAITSEFHQFIREGK